VALEIRRDNLPPDVAREVVGSPALAAPRDEKPVIVQTDLKYNKYYIPNNVRLGFYTM
jgi:hypothetical protein